MKIRGFLTLAVCLGLSLAAWAQPAPAPLPAPKSDVPADRRVPVAVIDTGIDVEHPQLKDHLVKDAQGAVDGHGYDKYYPLSEWSGRPPAALLPEDHEDFHGTFIASQVTGAAEAAEGTPVKDPVKVLPLKATTVAGALAALEYARKRGARVINMSLGTPADSRALRAGLRGETESLIVVPAGNAGQDLKESPFYPAAWPDRNLIRVGAVNENGVRLEGSNYGEMVTWGAAGAPASGLAPGGGRIEAGGTSLAAARMSRLAGLLSGDITEEDIKKHEVEEGSDAALVPERASIDELAEFVPGQLLVGVAQGPEGEKALKDLAELFKQEDGSTAKYYQELRPGLWVYRLPLRFGVELAMARAQELPGVAYAEPNYMLVPQTWGWVEALKEKVSSAASATWETTKDVGGAVADGATYVGGQVYHFGRGMVDGTVEAVKGTAEMVMHPIETVKAIKNAVQNWDQVKAALGDKWDEYVDAAYNDPQKFAYMTGRITAEIELAIVGAKGMDKLAKSKAVAALGTAVRSSRPVQAMGNGARRVASAARGTRARVPLPKGTTVARTGETVAGGADDAIAGAGKTVAGDAGAGAGAGTGRSTGQVAGNTAKQVVPDKPPAKGATQTLKDLSGNGVKGGNPFAGQMTAEQARAISKEFTDAVNGALKSGVSEEAFEQAAKRLADVAAKHGVNVTLDANATRAAISKVYRELGREALSNGKVMEAVNNYIAALMAPPSVIPEGMQNVHVLLRDMSKLSKAEQIAMRGAMNVVGHEFTHAVHASMARGIAQQVGGRLGMSADDIGTAIARYEAANVAKIEAAAARMGTLAKAGKTAEYMQELEKFSGALAESLVTGANIPYNAGLVYEIAGIVGTNAGPILAGTGVYVWGKTR